MTCSYFIYPSMDIIPTPELEDMKRTCATAAIIRAASNDMFSVRDVWRELGLGGKSSQAITARQNCYSYQYLQKVMKHIGVESIQIKNRTAAGRRYFIPGITPIKRCVA